MKRLLLGLVLICLGPPAMLAANAPASTPANRVEPLSLPLRLSMTADEVVAALGKPRSDNRAFGGGIGYAGLRVMFDPRITLQNQVSDQLKAHFGDKVFQTVIPRNVRLAEAPSYGQAGVVFDPSSKGAVAYIEFAREMVARLGQPAP